MPDAFPSPASLDRDRLGSVEVTRFKGVCVNRTSHCSAKCPPHRHDRVAVGHDDRGWARVITEALFSGSADHSPGSSKAGVDQNPITIASSGRP